MTTKKSFVDSLPNNPIWVSASDFEAVCYTFAKEHLEFDQPIPAFATRSPGILESCLITPLQTYDNHDLYPTFIDKLSILLFLLIKNHPFVNGNKRLALVTAMVVMSINGLWIDVPRLELYTFIKDIARSDGRQKEKTLVKISRFLSLHLTKLKTPQTN